MVILSKQSALLPTGSKSILYIDGFAGPGVYAGGEPGSPIVAVQAALQHQGNLPVPVRFLFVELDRPRFESLQRQIGLLKPQMIRSTHVAAADARQGDCTAVLTDLVSNPEQLGGKFGPAMVFLDQFGYSQIPITLIGSIMDWPQCEVLSYLNWDHLNRYITDPNKAEGISRAFGSERWREAIPLPGHKRRDFLLGLYREALKAKGNADYVLDFAMYGANDTLLYWLFFSTNHLRGLEEMKKAMWKVDTSGSFRFSDQNDPGQMLLMKGHDEEWLANELAHRLVGKVMSVSEIRDYVLTSTPCYLFKTALKKLEVTKRCLRPLNPRPGRVAGTYGDEDLSLKLEFMKPSVETVQSGLFG